MLFGLFKYPGYLGKPKTTLSDVDLSDACCLNIPCLLQQKSTWQAQSYFIVPVFG